MHLKQLKLAGFKSFVDPTVVHFPSQLVAVVGPNGCGKSNIIDAVRWVMGESSARNLRGESMTDVIFNGSSTRKPIGQASVELVFDNSMGRLTGPFASYGEIAVKRVVTRDGDSSYYLNGSRCRRKDITDIFLGTGAGARGYSIIGQGTISQLIEARPEDLRVFLEEAAGVSKYKERRKETLQRIAHTRDNLTRVADIREELDKQLHRLERQAKAAERYLILKEEEQLCRAEILALKWQDFTQQQMVKQRELHDLVLIHEQQQSRLTKAQTERVVFNEKLHDVEEQTQQIQAVFYQLGTEIARLEETIQQQAREKKRLEHDQQQLQADWQAAAQQLQQDQEEFHQCQEQIYDLEEKLAQLKQQFRMQEEGWQDRQHEQKEWDLRWQEIQTTTNRLKSELQIAHVKAEHLNEKQNQTRLRLEKLSLEQESISLDALQRTQQELQEKQEKLIENQQFDEAQLKQSTGQTNLLRAALQNTEHDLHQLQDSFHRLNSEYAALLAAQRAARQSANENRKNIPAWTDKPRLMDILQVDEHWQKACELILNDALHAYVLEAFDELWPQRGLCELQGEHAITLKGRPKISAARPLLIDKIHSDIPAHTHVLEHIYAAEHLDEAVTWLAELADHQSIVTPQGFWIGKGWVKFAAVGERDELGFLARKQKISELALEVESLQEKINELRKQRDDLHHELQKNLSASELHQLNVNASNEALRAHQTTMHAHEQSLAHAEKLLVTLSDEISELHFVLEETVTEHLAIVEHITQLQHQSQESELQQEHYFLERKKCLNALEQHKKEVEEARLALHHGELTYEKAKNKMQQLDERIHREQERLSILQERLESLVLLCAQAQNPEGELHLQLEQQLLKHTEIESQLILSREQASQLKMELEDLEKNILNCDQELKRTQERISQIRMEEQALSVRASSVQESLDESGLHASVLLERIPAGITQSIREDELIALMEKIKRLGAINLAAIEEFSSEQQRKLYLDEQYNDLSQALATLETAIDKMDKETRLRLENTFDEVNTSFKSLFPRLFGGGKAQLELTCENLLEAGIVVMAQPPGKRNSTIHLLSGGEKAMTAVALVFAIFQLNPSPFCMLDEVDAPLDDVNVGRFCAMVKEMSEFVQFLFITHNKVTMELADHLMGVTMREPGVSRLVAVDVTQALAME